MRMRHSTIYRLNLMFDLHDCIWHRFLSHVSPSQTAKSLIPAQRLHHFSFMSSCRHSRSGAYLFLLDACNANIAIFCVRIVRIGLLPLLIMAHLSSWANTIWRNSLRVCLFAGASAVQLSPHTALVTSSQYSSGPLNIEDTIGRSRMHLPINITSSYLHAVYY